MAKITNSDFIPDLEIETADFLAEATGTEATTGPPVRITHLPNPDDSTLRSRQYRANSEWVGGRHVGVPFSADDIAVVGTGTRAYRLPAPSSMSVIVDRDHFGPLEVRMATTADAEGTLRRLQRLGLLNLDIVSALAYYLTDSRNACLLYTSPSPRD